MEKLSFITGKSAIAKGIVIAGVLALTATGLFKGKDFMNEYLETKKQVTQISNVSTRKTETNEMITKGNFDDASARIKLYEESSALPMADIADLKIKLTETKKATEIQKQKSEKLARYEDLIAKYSIISASNALSEIRISNLFDSNTVQSLETKLADINPENMLKSIETKVGEDKIALMENFAKHYKEHPKAQEIRQRTLKGYFGVASSHFKTNADVLTVNSLLDRFRLWIINNKDVVKGNDFLEFLGEAKVYALLLSKEKGEMIYPADTVKIVVAWGGTTKDNQPRYTCINDGEIITPKEIPLGTAGFVKRMLNGDELGTYIIEINKKEYRFLRREIERVFESDAPKIMQQLTEIEKLVQEAGK